MPSRDVVERAVDADPHVRAGDPAGHVDAAGERAHTEAAGVADERLRVVDREADPQHRAAVGRGELGLGDQRPPLLGGEARPRRRAVGGARRRSLELRQQPEGEQLRRHRRARGRRRDGGTSSARRSAPNRASSRAGARPSTSCSASRRHDGRRPAGVGERAARRPGERQGEPAWRPRSPVTLWRSSTAARARTRDGGVTVPVGFCGPACTYSAAGRSR